MSKDALMSWKEECDVIHKEMDRLLTAGWLETAEERQVRRIQFVALIERRNVAAQNLLKSDGGTAKLSYDQLQPSEAPGEMTKTEPTLEVTTIDAKISQEPSDAAVVNRSPQVLSSHRMFGLNFTDVKVSQEPTQPPIAVKGDSQPTPADAMSEVERKNFKLLFQEAAAPFERERNPQEPPADPMFEVGTFLKFLGLR
jgi:hypothetical protein